MQSVLYSPSYDIEKAAVCQQWYPLKTQRDIDFCHSCFLFHGRVDRLEINGKVYDINQTPITPDMSNLPNGYNINIFVQIGWLSPTIEIRMEDVRAFNFPLFQILSYAVIELKGDKVFYYDNNNCTVLADRMFWRYHKQPPYNAPSWVIGVV